MEIRALNFTERKYTYAQSRQLQGQTGSIGYLRGDFGSSGQMFYTTWEDCNESLKTDEFKDELDQVINDLRKPGSLLENIFSMRDFKRGYPNSAMEGNYTTEYGFRVDTEKYAYLLRCNPTKGDYNFYCWAFVKEHLDRHIENARKDIRFIDSRYNNLFMLPDGERIRIKRVNGAVDDHTCRYIDEYHVQVSSNIYHICEFAEFIEHCKARCTPVETPLPQYCFSTDPKTGAVVRINRYENQLIPMRTSAEDGAVNKLNEAIGVTPEQAAAMAAGVAWGWDSPKAKPDYYL